jgi:hypothetical protein
MIATTTLSPGSLQRMVERSRCAAAERELKEASHGGGRVVMFFGVDFPDSG